MHQLWKAEASRPEPWAIAYMRVAADLCATAEEAWEVAVRADAMGFAREAVEAVRIMMTHCRDLDEANRYARRALALRSPGAAGLALDVAASWR